VVEPAGVRAAVLSTHRRCETSAPLNPKCRCAEIATVRLIDVGRAAYMLSAAERSRAWTDNRAYAVAPKACDAVAPIDYTAHSQ